MHMPTLCRTHVIRWQGAPNWRHCLKEQLHSKAAHAQPVTDTSASQQSDVLVGMATSRLQQAELPCFVTCPTLHCKRCCSCAAPRVSALNTIILTCSI